ncbi:MAG: polyphosphate kinase 1 [Bryobacteraceae bacterium]|nr:polyphosphate kinase 1 [Bryobacteraceae bacterium]
MPTLVEVVPVAEEPNLRDPELYLNRELSLLAFQHRVLEEAQDERNPLLDRVKFLSIVGSNLDEFFMVRVAGLLTQVEAGSREAGPDGLSASSQLVAIRREVKKLLADAWRCWRDSLLPALRENGIEILDYEDLTVRQQEIARKYFRDTVFPVLTPLAFDPSRPFPHISNLSVNLAITIDDKGTEKFARLKIPPLMPFVLLQKPGKYTRRRPPKTLPLVWLDQVITANLADLFPGMTVREAHPFHITRDSDLAIRELEGDDLLETVEEGVRQRRFGSVVRLMVTDNMPADMLEILSTNLEIERRDIYKVHGQLSLGRLMALYKLDRPDLKEATFVPAVPASLHEDEDEDIFAAIRRRDILLHHPFDSFQPVVDFVRKAAHDPNVLAIKMTLYRVGRNSPIVEALLEAMENGKQVAVLVELKARFDEESNIEWARALEREGVHVVYGLVGLKIHCKTTMIVRREGETIRRYLHLATGNYNVVTSHLYTDLGLLTCNQELAADTTDLFNYLTGYSAKSDYRRLLVAPVNLRDRLQQLIRREIELHRQLGAGRLIFKMNALVDPQMIRLLYTASQAGVQVDLLIRGICCLRPGVAGVSDNIRVRSIVGRFLEHSRIYYFRNAGDREIYLGSADMMQRNINRRVEVMFPLREEEHRAEVERVLLLYLADNVKAREMASDGTYSRPTPETNTLNAQESLIPASDSETK